MQVMLMRLMSKGEYVIIPKGTKSTGSSKLGLRYVKRTKFSNLTQVIFPYANFNCPCLKIGLCDLFPVFFCLFVFFLSESHMTSHNNL